MVVVKKQVNTIRITFKCDQCNDGNLEYTGSIDKMGGFVRYQHSCTNTKCHSIKYLDNKYPRVEYSEVELKQESGQQGNNHHKNGKPPKKR